MPKPKPTPAPRRAAPKPKPVMPAAERRTDAPPPAPPAVHPGYHIDLAAPDLLDPGTVAALAVCGETRRQLDAARGAALRGALDDLLTRLVGGPRAEVLPRAYLHFAGPAGLLAARPVTSPDGKYTATPADGVATLPLRPVAAVTAVGPAGEWDVTDRALGGDRRPSPADAYGCERVRVGFAPSPGGGVPGLLWELPAPVAARLAAVRVAGGPDLAWRLDRRGWVHVPPRPDADAPTRDGRLWVEFDLPVRPGEWTHVGRLWSGVVEAEVRCDDPGEEFLAPPAGALAVPGEAAVDQPWAGEPGACGEDAAAWAERAADEVRHRGRAVTADDYRDLVARAFPVAVLAVEPTAVLRGGRYRPAVRVVLVPRAWGTLAECLAGGVAYGRAAERLLAGRAVEGVGVVAGPPCVRADAAPHPADPLWPYRAFLAGPAAGGAAARDGVLWPVVAPADLRGATRD